MGPMRRSIALIALAALAFAACSDDDAGTEAGGGSSTTTTTAPESTTTTEPPPVPSPGCGAATEAQDKERHAVELGSTERWWRQTAPARAADDDPMPLVVDFHGLAEGADIATAMSKFGELGMEEGFATVFPNGTGQPVRWETTPGDPENPDLEFVGTMLEGVSEELCIDESRIYAAGLSMGGFMSSLVACEMSGRFAAVAPVAGLQFPDGCNPGRPIPVLSFHGTADPILLFNGGVNTDALRPVLGGDGPTTTSTSVPTDLDGEGYPAAARDWAEQNGCEGSSDEDVSEEVILRTFDCPDGADVEFYIIEGGGHSWPGSEFSKSIESIVGPTTFDIDATDLIWTFFQGFRLPS